MAKITKAGGLTVSNARVKRGGALVAAVAEPETQTVVATHIEVPVGSAASVVAWIGDDADRATAARDAGDDRRSVVRAVAAVLGDDG